MGARLSAAAIAAAALLLSTCLGAPPSLEYPSYELDIAVGADGLARERVAARVANRGPSPLDKVSFIVGREVTGIEANASVPASVRVREVEWARAIELLFDPPLPPGASADYTISFSTSQFTRASGDGLELSTTYRAAWPIASFRARVELPPGFVLPQAENATQSPPVVAPPARLETDGDHIILRWERRPMASGESIDLLVRARRAPSPQPWPWWALVFALGALAGLAAWAAARRVPSALSGFSLDERILLLELTRRSGRATQSELARSLGFSRSKLSRLLGGLEAKGSLSRERSGTVNRVALDPGLLEACRREGR